LSIYLFRLLIFALITHTQYQSQVIHTPQRGWMLFT
jgi:hypothetical protein